MKYSYRLIVLFLIILTLHSCLTKEKAEKIFTDDSFQSTYKIRKGKTLKMQDDFLMNPQSMVFHPEGYLIFTDSQSENLIKIFNLKTGTFQELIKKGRGPNECNHISNISLIKNDVWLHEPTLRKMLNLKMDTLGFFYIEKELNIGVQAGKFIALKDDLFVGTVYSNDRIAYYNQNGELLQKAGGFPIDINENIQGILPNIIFQSVITASPDGKYIVLANLSIDLLEIYSSIGDTVLRLNGPDDFRPIIKVHDVGVGRTFSLDPFFSAYKDIKALPNEIWASYSGNEVYKDQMSSPNIILPNKIYCLSWSGKPVRIIEIDTFFLSFAIDPQNKKLYCLEKESDIKIIEYDISEIEI